MVYKTINDVPQEGRRLIIQLLERGVIDSKDGEINIDEVIYKVLIILARLDLIWYIDNSTKIGYNYWWQFWLEV